MPILRWTPLAALAFLLTAPVSLHAKTTDAIANAAAPQLLAPLPMFNPSPKLAQSIVPSYAGALMDSAARTVARRIQVDPTSELAEAAPAKADGSADATDLRKSLLALAMKLRDIRYVRGGHSPITGFDCSGFVRYVFEHAIGIKLPTNSAAQFLAGLKVKRADMKAGDLVFFHTHGRHRISHVGIYISDGRFIHSPTTGKSVEISSLDNAYWARHFAGAKRAEEIAQASHNG